MHLGEFGPSEELNGMLPGLGQDWSKFMVAQSTAVYHQLVYASQWEMVAARWAEGDDALLQPQGPS